MCVSDSPLIRALSSGALSGPTVLQIWGMDLLGSLTKTVNLSQINSPPIQISLKCQQFLEPLTSICGPQYGGRRLRRPTGPTSKAGPTTRQICDFESLNSSGPHFPRPFMLLSLSFLSPKVRRGSRCILRTPKASSL